MSGYIVNFAIYTMAMLGLIFFALMVYQKFSGENAFGKKKNGFLKIEETLTLGPRKSLQIVRVGDERFLIASDSDKTSLISKLDSNLDIGNIEAKDKVEYGLDELYGIEKPVKKPVKQSVEELPVIVNFSEKKKNPKVIQNMLRKINE